MLSKDKLPITSGSPEFKAKFGQNSFNLVDRRRALNLHEVEGALLYVFAFGVFHCRVLGTDEKYSVTLADSSTIIVPTFRPSET